MSVDPNPPLLSQLRSKLPLAHLAHSKSGKAGQKGGIDVRSERSLYYTYSAKDKKRQEEGSLVLGQVMIVKTLWRYVCALILPATEKGTKEEEKKEMSPLPRIQSY